MSLDMKHIGEEQMSDKCPHHDSLESNLDEIRSDVRAIRSTVDQMMLHMIPQRVNGGGGTTGPNVTVTATGQQAAPAQPTNEVYWLKVAVLCLVILSAGSTIYPRVAALLGQILH